MGLSDAPPLVCLHGVCGTRPALPALVEDHLAGRFHVRALTCAAMQLRLGGAVDIAQRRGRAGDGHGAGDLDRPQFRRAPHRRGDRAEARARRAGGAARPGAVGSARRGESAARYELSRGPWSSVEEALVARAATVEHTPRELLEEEMREHLVEQPDGSWFYRYSRDAVAAAYREMAGSRRLGDAAGADPPRGRRPRKLERRRARALSRSARRPPGSRRRARRAHRPLGLRETSTAITAFLH